MKLYVAQLFAFAGILAGRVASSGGDRIEWSEVARDARQAGQAFVDSGKGCSPPRQSPTPPVPAAVTKSDTADWTGPRMHRWMLSGPPIDVPPLRHICIDCGEEKDFYLSGTPTCPGRSVGSHRPGDIQMIGLDGSVPRDAECDCEDPVPTPGETRHCRCGGRLRGISPATR